MKVINKFSNKINLKIKFLSTEFPINKIKVLNNHLVKTPMMTNIAENIDNEYVLTAILTIRENKRLEIKAIKDYINKNFARRGA